MSDKKSRPIEATVEAAKENIKTSEQTDSSPDVLKRESLEFLKKLRPGGPWVLTAITPDGPATTITATNADEALAFVRANDGKKNIYYSVNPTRTPMTKKATKADIAAIEFGLADLDPNDGETPEDAKARYLAALETHEPPPTAVIDSGNGIQALWRVEPIPLEGDTSALVELVEGRVKALMERLGSVAGTQNIDRILRLPGTINLPNRKKLENGRKPCATSLIEFNGATCSLDDFPPPAAAKPEQPKAKTTETKGKRLPPMLASMLHVAGSGEYKSRSELLFAFVTSALRNGIDESLLIASCLDEKYRGHGIFEHVSENGGEDYIKKQIENALNEAPTRGEKAIIRCHVGLRHQITDQMERALIAAGCNVFYRGGVLVEPLWRLEKSAESNSHVLAASLVKLNPARLSYMVGKHAANFQKFDKRNVRWEVTDAPIEAVNQLLELGDWGFPTVRGIINSPTMRPDGSLLTEPGYDKATQLWYKSAGDVELPTIPERPSQDDGRAALKLLTDLLEGFPFKDDVSKSVAVAALMTPVLRGAFEFAPMFLILAPEPGSGKSYLVSVVATLETGRPAIPISLTENKEETDKRLSAAAFEAKPILHLNNLDFDLESGLLNAMITEGTVDIRQFGKNDQTIRVDCRGTTIFANGNNIRIVGDLVRRTLTARIDTKSENPEKRTFTFDPIERIKADRGKFLAAVFTIVRAYAVANDPAVDVKPLNGFVPWCRKVREPLIWLGMSDPVTSMEGARAADPVREALRQRIDGLVSAFGIRHEFTSAEVLGKINETSVGMSGKSEASHSQLVNGFTRADGKAVNAVSIGNQLVKDIDRVAGGRWIERTKSDRRDANRFRIWSEEGGPKEPETEVF